MSVVDGGTSGDQVLDGVESLAAVLDNVDLEASLLKTGLGSLDAFSTDGLGVVVVGEGSQLGVGLGKSGEGVGDVGVLGVGRHFCCLLGLVGFGERRSCCVEDCWNEEQKNKGR